MFPPRFISDMSLIHMSVRFLRKVDCFWAFSFILLFLVVFVFFIIFFPIGTGIGLILLSRDSATDDLAKTQSTPFLPHLYPFPIPKGIPEIVRSILSRTPSDSPVSASSPVIPDFKSSKNHQPIGSLVARSHSSFNPWAKSSTV